MTNTLDILTVAEAAKLLGCTEGTLREKTPHIIPGAKFGRDWVYSRMLIVAAVERESNEAATKARIASKKSGQKRDFFEAIGVTTKKPPSLKV